MTEYQFDGFVLDPEERKFQEEIVSPTAAKQLLAKYAAKPVDDDGIPSNRDRRDRNVRNYARDMASGKWFDTGDSIKIASDATLRDGQHRLEAVVKANVPVQFMIFTGMDPAAQQGVDIGAGRTAADHAKLKGIKNAAAVMSITRRVIGWDLSRKTYVGGGWTAPTVSEMLDWVEANPAIYQAVQVYTQSRLRIPVAPSVVASAYYICARIEVFAAEEFFVKQLISLENMPAGAPARALRFRLEEAKNQSRNGRNMGPDTAFRFILLAWNHYRDGNFISKLQAPKGGWTSGNTPDPR